MRHHGQYLLLLGAMVMATPGWAGMKCWTNHEGVTECGNTVPPEYAQTDTRTLNDRGITVEEKRRAKTPEELAAEARRQRAEQQHRQAERRREAQQRARDRVLLGTFASEQDIVRARDRKLAAIDGMVELTRASIGKLQEKLSGYRQRADTLAARGKPVPKELEGDIDTVSAQIEHKQHYLTMKQQERQQLRDRYDADLARFRELMQQHAQ